MDFFEWQMRRSVESNGKMRLALYSLKPLLFLLCFAANTRGLVIGIKSNGVDDPVCLRGNISKPCKTLNYIAKCQGQLPSENITISVCPHESWISGHLNFQNLKNFTLRSDYELKIEGFSFRNISGLYLIPKSFRSIKGLNYSIMLSIEYCQDVTIMDTIFIRVKGTAMFLKNNYGSIFLTNLKFIKNINNDIKSQIESYSGGLEIVSNSSTPAKYVIHNCTFKENTAPDRYQSFTTTNRANTEWRGQSLGGALSLYFQEKSSNQEIVISSSVFVKNKAMWGSGMHVMFQGLAIGNTLQVTDTNFTDNAAKVGGGGVCIRYFKKMSSTSCSEFMHKQNLISFTRVMFARNDAIFGAGLVILSTYNLHPSDAGITFSECTWLMNSAVYGSAVLVSPALFQLLSTGNLPVPEFINCQIKCNFLKIISYKTGISYSDRFAGIFIIIKSTVRFGGVSSFEQNNDSAIYLNSGTVVFNSNSKVRLYGNSALSGGGIALFGYSSVLLNQNSSFLIENNTARSLGGAIYYHSEDQHDLKYGRVCFIRPENPTISEDTPSTIHMRFDNNSAGVLGQSIYSSTLYPCHFFNSHSAGISDILNRDIFDFIGDIVFDNAEDAVSTSSKTLNNSNIESEYNVFPGGSIHLSLIPVDEFGRSHPNIHSYQVEMMNQRILIDRQFTVLGKLSFAGAQGAKDMLIVSQNSLRKLSILVNISLLHCPPGFYYDENSETCECTTNGSSQYFYYGISSCNMDNFHVNLHPGFWMGYISYVNVSPDTLFTAICPMEFCQYHIPEIEVSSNHTELHKICQTHRTGILCGECEANYSPFYHSQNSFMCGEDTLCSFGILFYILSELVPVTILFTAIILLDLRFTSGGINGFVFYSQIIESLLMKRKLFSDKLEKALLPSKIFYNIFNFDFFSMPSLSFCLWKNAKIIDIVAFKYVTVIFAFVLILFLILILKKMKWNRLENAIDLKKISVINGISTFLILCYSQCIKTSFFILSPAQLRTQGGIPGNLVTVYGGSLFLNGRHLLYSLMAISCILTIVIIPPVVLLSYPMLLHILGLCKLSEHWLVNNLLSLFMINRLKPLIDSFQSCYRDKVRFFAGLYFIYRIVILATFSIAHSTAQYHTLIQLSLSTFLGIHCAVQPYKKRLHNVLDSLLLLLLVVINACTIFTDIYDVQYRDNYFYGANTIQFVFLAVQVILIYIPMLSFLGWLIHKVFMKKLLLFAKKLLIICKKRKKLTQQNVELSLEYRKLT